MANPEKVKSEEEIGNRADLNECAENIIKSFVVSMIRLGSGITELVYSIAKRINKYASVGFNFVKRIIKTPLDRLTDKVKNSFRRIPEKFSEYRYSFKSFIDKTKSIGETYGKLDASKFFFITTGKKIWSCRGAATTAFNWVAPILSIAFLASVISYSRTLDYGIGVECNGEELGIVAEEGAYDEAEKMLQQRINYVEGNETVTITPKLSVKVVKDTTEIINPNELADKMIGNTDSELLKAWGIYIDGEFIGAVENREVIENSLAAILERNDVSGAKSVKFAKPVNYKSGLYLQSSMVEENEIIRLINSDVNSEVSYTVENGDSPYLIAQKNNMTMDEVLQLNPQLKTRCLVGDKVVLAQRQPYMPVEVVKEMSYTEEKPFDIVRVEDSSQYKGVESIIQKGVTGKHDVVAEVTYVNGYETGREIISEKITQQPVTQRVSVGTKTPKPARGATATNTIYQWPVAGGYISSHFGDTAGRRKPHYATDIAAPHGTPVFAAEDGVVTMAQWYYGYGNCIQIQHPDGNVTLYGHMSKLLVSPGQQVTRGEVIGLVGNTGESYGNHLHFEVKRNGVKYDPEQFICD